MFRIPPQYLSSIFIPICIITSNIVTFTVFTVKKLYYYLLLLLLLNFNAFFHTPSLNTHIQPANWRINFFDLLMKIDWQC